MATDSGPHTSGEDGQSTASDRTGEVAHAALRGWVAAMAMSGMREFTVAAGIVKQTPPQAIAKQRARGVVRHVPRGRRREVVELAHWAFGASGGAAFGVLPDSIRRRAWAGPAYGLLVWLAFETVAAPALGLSHAKKLRPVERIALAVDHLLYGLVLSEGRSRPQE